jgi:hypothetical protein
MYFPNERAVRKQQFETESMWDEGWAMSKIKEELQPVWHSDIHKCNHRHIREGPLEQNK